MDTISFKRHRFPPEIIRRAVWLYARFTLSYRDVEDLLAERGLDISYESVRRWFLKFGAPIARNLRHTRPIPNGYWHLDEMVIVIRGQRYWLWRAVDNEGEVLDFLVQSKRNAQAAFQITGFGPTLPEHPGRRLQHLLCPAAFTQQIHVQTISKRRIQSMGKCECGRLKGNPCGPLRPNTINVTMPEASAAQSWRSELPLPGARD